MIKILPVKIPCCRHQAGQHPAMRAQAAWQAMQAPITCWRVTPGPVSKAITSLIWVSVRMPLSPETRHVGAGIEGLCVVDLRPGIFDDFFALTTHLAVLIQRRSDVAEGNFFLSDLVTGVAIAAIDAADSVRRLHAATILRDLFAGLPTAEILAVSRILHCFQLRSFQCFGFSFGKSLGYSLHSFCASS